MHCQRKVAWQGCFQEGISGQQGVRASWELQQSMLKMRQYTVLILRAGCHRPCRMQSRMTPGPRLTLSASMAYMTATCMCAEVSRMLGHMQLRRWMRASSQPRPCTPRARCLMVAVAVWRCTRSRSSSASSMRPTTEQMQSLAISPTYSNMKAKDLSTPFCTFRSWTRYSFISAGITVKGPQHSATIAIATVVQMRRVRSCTFRLFSRVTSTSCGPMAFAIYPKLRIVALRIFFLLALSSSSRSKHTRIHSFGDTCRAPLRAILPTSSMRFSCTFSFLLRRMGVSLGSRSLMGGCILLMPTSSTTALRAPRIDPSTSGYSSPRFSNSIDPSFPSFICSPHSAIGFAISRIRSAACCLSFVCLFLSRKCTIPQICWKCGPALSPSPRMTAPKQFTMASSSRLWSWKAQITASISWCYSFWLRSIKPHVSASFCTVSRAIFLKASFSSLRKETMYSRITEPPTFWPRQTVVSTRSLQFRLSAACLLVQKPARKGTRRDSLMRASSTPLQERICFTTRKRVFISSQSGVQNSLIKAGTMCLEYCEACLSSISGIMYPTAFMQGPRERSRSVFRPSHRGTSTDSKASIPKGKAASANAAMASAAMLMTFRCSSFRDCQAISTSAFRCSSIEQPEFIASCWITASPVCLAVQLFLLWQTALRKGSRLPTPCAMAITAKARAVVVRTRWSEWSISGLMATRRVGRPTALDRLTIICLPQTRTQQSSSTNIGSMTARMFLAQGLTSSSSLQSTFSITLTRVCRQKGSSVGLIIKGSTCPKMALAPNSLALKTRCLTACFRWGGLPFLMLWRQLMTLRSLCSYRGSRVQSTFSSSFPKYTQSSGFTGGRPEFDKKPSPESTLPCYGISQAGSG